MVCYLNNMGSPDENRYYFHSEMLRGKEDEPTSSVCWKDQENV